ncbi:MAG TPA: TerB family tellurite resistance protein [Terriglobales bacterium]|nr:TerB family tellurite resistance protein [Terriglobales bacterium]
MSIVDFLGLGKKQGSSPQHADTIRTIVQALDRLESERAKYVAAFAYVLSRVARADLHISEEETREMERLVSQIGGLPEEQAVLVVQIAKTQNILFGGTENFLITEEFNRIATREQKLKLLECLFAVSSSDQSVSSAEDHEIRQIARELQLTHEDYIGVRLLFREHLAVLKDRAPE